MKDKLKIPYPVVVEGKYDRTRLLCVMDGQILTTDGFGVFNKPEKLALIRALSKKTKIIVLSDSDGAGKLIRSHITGAIPKDRLIQLYIPRIEGTEKRKKEPSKEGTLGVEGMKASLLYDLLLPYADGSAVERAESNPLSKADLYRDGLSGKPDSAAMRDKFCALICLPPKMTANALLAATKLLLSYDEYIEIIKKIG
jgi:ribonuclease M5